MTARVAPPPVAARLRALDDAMFAVQREYISESAGLSANELRQIEAKADERMRSLRSRRSALVRELRKQGLLP